MKLIDRILLATDFKGSSENLVRNAIELARAYESKIVLLHVLPDEKYESKAKYVIEEAAKKQLDKIRNWIYAEGIKTETPILEHGSFSERIIQTANLIDANVIVIGSGEPNKTETIRLGHTAELVVQQSDRPVWVVKNNAPFKIGSILCPVDFSPESELALKNSILIARRFNAELNIVSVIQLPYHKTTGLKVDWEVKYETSRSEYIKEFNTFLKKFNLKSMDWEKEVMVGDPSVEILKALSNYESDLVIMGFTGMSSMNKELLGRTTKKVIRQLPCSFITLKSIDIIALKLENRIQSLEYHYNSGMQLLEDGFFNDAINEFKACLTINDMHLPSLKGIALCYEELGEIDNVEKYNNMEEEIISRVWDYDE